MSKIFVYAICPCNSFVRIRSLDKHFNSIKHILYCQNNNIKNIFIPDEELEFNYFEL
jgi:hypothetical protein